MAYEYITDNNLYNKQNYMYSKYRGGDFLKEYMDSRRKCMDSISFVNIEVEPLNEVCDDMVQKDLSEILRKLEEQDCDRDLIDRMNAYTKTFEVRKRIYSAYDSRWKPVKDAVFENYKSYLLFADCLLHMYENTRCLKYFSCLLKVDDTLLSVRNHLKKEHIGYLGKIINCELNVFNQLAYDNGIDLG